MKYQTNLYNTRLNPNYEEEHLSEFYAQHISAMTGEQLHSKSEIAWELAARDREIKRLNLLLEGRDIDGKLIPAKPL